MIRLEKIVLGDNGEVSDGQFFNGSACLVHNIACKKYDVFYGLPWITIFGHSWYGLSIIFTHHLGNHLTSDQNVLFMVRHKSFYVYFHNQNVGHLKKYIFDTLSNRLGVEIKIENDTVYYKDIQ